VKLFFLRYIPVYTILIALLAAMIPPLAPSAVSEAEVMPSATTKGYDTVFEPSPSAVTGVLDRMEDDFNRATVDWSITGGRAEAVTALEEAPYSVFEGSRSLLILPENSSSVSLSREPKGLSSLADVHYVAAVVYAPTDGGRMSLSLSITGRGGEYFGSAFLTAGRWQVVLFDVAEATLPVKATSLTLTLSSSEGTDNPFLLDCLGASTGESAPVALRYLASDLRAEGCEGRITEEGIVSVTFRGERAYLEAAVPAMTDFSGGVGLRVKLKNASTCSSLTLQYTTLSSSDYTETNTVTATIPVGEDTVSCLFPLPVSYAGRFRLRFEGVPVGSVEIQSISAVPCYTSSFAVLGSIAECAVGRNGTVLSVKGSVRPEEAERYRGAPLLLYKLSVWEEVGAISTARPALAETVLNGTEFAFSLPLSAERDELFGKYVAAVYYEGSLLPVGQPAFVTNPEALADYSNAQSLSSVKGSRPLEGDYLFDGVSCTAVEVHLDRLVSLRESALTHRTGSVVGTFDPSYVAELDKRMTELSSCGVKAYLILRLSLPDDLSLKNLLCHPDAIGRGDVAFNTLTEEGIGALRAAVDFLTRRYGASNGQTDNLMGFVVGTEVNSAATHYDAGSPTLSALAKTYGNALRIVYNAAKAVSSGTEIYLPLGGRWYSAAPSSQTSSFDARSMLEAVFAYLAEGGNIAVRVAYDVYQSGCAYEIEKPDLTEEAATVSAANLEVLTGYLGRNRLLMNGIVRPVILLEAEEREAKDENERIRLSADYVYTYLRLKSRGFASVRAMIPAHPVGYNGILTYLDTNHFSEVTAFAAELIGAERFDALLLGGSVPADRYVLENKAVTMIPSGVKGEINLFDFSQGAAGWYGAMHCADLKGGVSLDGRSGLLSVRFAKASADVRRGIAVTLDKPLDLSSAPYIGFTCRPAVLPENVSELELTVVVSAGNSSQISSLTVKAGVDTTVVVDMTTFAQRSACQKIAIYVKGVKGQDIGEPTLLIGSIRAMSESFTGSDLDQVIRPSAEEELGRPAVTLQTLMIIAAVGIVALLLEIVRIVLRRRQAGVE